MKIKRIVLLVILINVFVSVIFSQAKDKKTDKRAKMEKQFIDPSGVSPGSGYSHAISVKGGTTIYISGQVAFDSEGNLIGKNDIKAQTQQVFKNIEAILKASNATFKDVVKFNYYVKNFKPEFLPAIREVRDKFLPKDQPPPTSALIGVESLFREDVLIEIECVAVVY